MTVFEKDTIGGASTAKSAGTVCLFDDSLKNRYWDVRLYGFESYLKMEEEEKGSAGFDKTGTLVVATNEEVEKVIKTGIALAKAAGYTGEYITDKDRIKEILPDISTENILGAGYTEDDLKEKFGALYNAFQFGAPPHAGMAPGVDRMIMLLRNEENIREIIAFPMSGTAQDLMCGAPNEITEQQLREVHIKVRD